MIRRFAAPRRRRGIALVLILFAMVLMAVLLGSFALVARTEALETRTLFDGARARYAAEAGLSRSIYELRRNDLATRWVADGRDYHADFEDAAVTVQVFEETGKVDINAADQQSLRLLMLAVGIEQVKADQLVDAILDWRDPDDLKMPNGAEDKDYQAAGYPYGSADAPFGMVEELQQVMGMDYETYSKLEPHVTVYTRSQTVNAAFADEIELMTIPGMTPELATQIVAQRRAFNLATANTPGAGTIPLPNGSSLSLQGGGVTYTVRSTARLPNGVQNTLIATVRLGGLAGQRAYTILRWRYGSSES